MTAHELAKRIDAHLRHFETDPEINAVQFYERNGKRESRGRPYYGAGAIYSGRWVKVLYITYQGWDNLTRDEARQYLDWLDAGNIGRHFEARQAAQKGG